VRIRVIFLLQNKGAVVPFHHQYLIYDKVTELMGDSMEGLEHPELCFSGIKGQTGVNKHGLQYFSSRITIVFSSPNAAYMRQLLDRIFSLKQLSIGNLLLVPEYAEEEQIPQLEAKAKYLAISPIVILAPTSDVEFSKRFVNPVEDEFSDLIFNATMHRMQSSGMYSRYEMERFSTFQVLPDMDYLNRMKAGEKKFSRIYPVMVEGQKLEVRGYTFPFELYAAPEVQQFVLLSGIGALCSMGFGMLDVANQSLAPNAQPIRIRGEVATPELQRQFLPK
jgi:CRISPR-associated endoribonuclease Cas6